MKIEFLPNEADENEGLGDAGIETFRGSPYASVGRETGQNSNDVSDGSGEPVILKFNLIEISRGDLQAMNQFEQALQLCAKKAAKNEDEKEITFFHRALETVNENNIKVLEISDYNTTGLTGPCVEGTPFHSLIKGSGVSDKPDVTSGGSFGIGKNAVFAISDTQTAFYSTIYRDKATGEKKFLAQGKSVLVSHVDAEGINRRAKAYWGSEGYKPLKSQEEVPAWMRRDEIGTSIFALGFRELERWQYRIAASLIQNFFCAIHRDEMMFLLDHGSIEIDSSTVGGQFSDGNFITAADESQKFEDFEFSGQLYDCLTSKDMSEEYLQINGLGKVSIRILIKQGMPKRVGIIRNGMLITDSLGNFGDKFRRFPMYSDFVALVEPLSSEGIELLKKLENPSHDEFSAERLGADPRARDAAISAMQELARKIREAIGARALTDPEDEIILDELNEFFASAGHSDTPPDPESEEDPETFSFKPSRPPKRKPKSVPEGEGDEGGAGGNEGESEDGEGGQGKGEGLGEGGKGKIGRKRPVEISEFRNLKVDGSKGAKRLVLFTPVTGGPAVMRVKAAGMDSSEDLEIIWADSGRVKDGKLHVALIAGERFKGEVSFPAAYVGPIELSVFAEEEKEGENENQ